MLNEKELNLLMGQKVQGLRLKCKLSQEELAQKAELSRATIGSIENGEANVTLNNLVNIANALNVPPFQLINTNIPRFYKTIHQPDGGNLGEELRDVLESDQYRHFVFIDAYAKLSGVKHLESSILKFRRDGGRVTAFIGIDQLNTSYEALKQIYHLVDELFIVHNENLNHTFHHKVYLLEQNEKYPQNVFRVIGSNNLTSGGLFINYESCVLQVLDVTYPIDRENLEETHKLIDYYRSEECLISRKVDSETFIDTLLEDGYIIRESISSFIKGRQSQKKSKADEAEGPLFGKETFKAPKLNKEANRNDSVSKVQKEPIAVEEAEEVSTPLIIPQNILTESNEIFWYQMGASTGGSRNILDLSSTGSDLHGSVKGTKYETSDPNVAWGGVAFFEVDPTMHQVEKDVTITYNGNDYYPSTIKYAPNNKSWRIQLKGESSTDYNALSKYGVQCFRNHILMFIKVDTDHYILESYPESSMEEFKKKSLFYARNGKSGATKVYGRLA